jgi:UDP-3-O-[3-hydroxymyristoyl] glucosamine N-acyltransferase
MKLAIIAGLLNCTVAAGDGDFDIERIASPDSADANSITFLSDSHYAEKVRMCQARAVIVKHGKTIDGKINLEVADPYLGYAVVAQQFEDHAPVFGAGINPAAIINETASVHAGAHVGPGSIIGGNCTIGDRTVIAAGCVIEKNVTIAEDCRIDSGVIIRSNTLIGSRVIIQSGSVIGSDGFANARRADGSWVHIPCFGKVIVEDDVQIGANVTIDRGNFEPTIIRRGCRLDNLIQVAHNVEIGENSAIAAQVGISGSTIFGKRVLVGGQAGFAGHITIGDDSFVGAQSGVSKSVDSGNKITGTPARDLMSVRRTEVAQTKLPELLKDVKKLMKAFDERGN